MATYGNLGRKKKTLMPNLLAGKLCLFVFCQQSRQSQMGLKMMSDGTIKRDCACACRHFSLFQNIFLSFQVGSISSLSGARRS